jgi:5-(carboxyamino)imidazole ribonucleotide synthase
MNVGILGGGQLGRMLALAGYPLGLRFKFLDNDIAPAADLAELLTGEFDDPAVLDAFAAGLDVITYEFENVPVGTARLLERHTPVYPPPAALEHAQDRLTEKMLFDRLGIPTAPFIPVDDRETFERALDVVGLPAVLKTRRLGYDGKGQAVLRGPDDVAPAWLRLGGRPLILEAFVPFQRELSIIGGRGRDGQTVFYPLVQNEHQGGILRCSIAPAPALSPDLQGRAEELAGRLLAALEYVGVLALELFHMDDQLLANEFAPRVHNSGHWTIEGAVCSQFENHLRAVLGWPLGSTAAIGHSAMFNLIGTMPPMERLLAVCGSHVHNYGKPPRPGRKLGHITVCAPTPAEAGAAAAELSRIIGA